MCVDSPIFQRRKKGATAIIAEGQRSRLSFLVEASGWACHCDGRCPSAARALLISDHIDEKEFTTAFFQLCRTGQATKYSFVVSLQMREIFHLGPMKEIYPQGSVCLAPSASTFPLFHVEASHKSIQPRFKLSDGRTGFSSAAPVTQKIESLNNRANKEPTKPPSCGENTILCCGPDDLVLY